MFTAHQSCYPDPAWEDHDLDKLITKVCMHLADLPNHTTSFIIAQSREEMKGTWTIDRYRLIAVFEGGSQGWSENRYHDFADAQRYEDRYCREEGVS